MYSHVRYLPILGYTSPFQPFSHGPRYCCLHRSHRSAMQNSYAEIIPDCTPCGTRLTSLDCGVVLEHRAPNWHYSKTAIDSFLSSFLICIQLDNVMMSATKYVPVVSSSLLYRLASHPTSIRESHSFIYITCRCFRGIQYWPTDRTAG